MASYLHKQYIVLRSYFNILEAEIYKNLLLTILIFFDFKFNDFKDKYNSISRRVYEIWQQLVVPW